MGDAIVEVGCRERVIALPRPLRLGQMQVTERRYTIVHVRCASGVVGHAFAQTRGAPVAAIIERQLAAVITGRDAVDISARWEDMFRATIAVGRTGLVMRAMSLVDLACWDVEGRRCGLPVANLLSPSTTPGRIPVIYVAGYPGDHSELEGVVASAIASAHAGHTNVKVARTPAEPGVTRDLLDELHTKLPGGTRVIVDVNWGWRDVDEAVSELRTWPADRLAWVEDPFAPEEALMLAELRKLSPVPIGAGDDLTDRVHAQRLLDLKAVDVLRVDVAAIGGITGADRVVLAADRAGVPVSFHISPESSIHLAAVRHGQMSIETFDRSGNHLDPSHELVTGGPRFADGAAELSAEPGLGFEIRGEPAA